ncbi:hypothetical protein CRENBAI_021879 [Crenichthys baileyi]|uniref:Myc box-dependent-interacting protein 1 n=1 Tax=Crenichthys baileyi TaxID=28760 RepID=A0AAV9SRK8_9TELE
MLLLSGDKEKGELRGGEEGESKKDLGELQFNTTPPVYQWRHYMGVMADSYKFGVHLSVQILKTDLRCKMAELNLGKGLTAGKVASNVQKKLTRAQEKVLQKLGKADETKDAAFEEWVINFNKQYAEGSKLQRDLRAYLEAVRAMHESSKNLQACLGDMYEAEWYGKNEVDSILEDCDVLWTDYHQKLVDHALISMDTYLGQFPDIKARIAKRDRKLVDYDSARHNYATTHKTKKKDGGIKITKPSTLLERATPGWAQGILSAHNLAQTSLSKSQLDQDLHDVLETLENTETTSDRENSNHTLRPGGPPPIPKSPSKLRPAVPPPPKVTPSKELKTENIINLFDAAATPDISVTSPTEPANWDSWPENTDAEEEETQKHYDPVAAATEAWGDDGTQPIRYDPIAAATEGWGDDGTQPIRYDPVTPAQEGYEDDGSELAHYETVEEAQEGWGKDVDQPVKEELAAAEIPVDEAPADVVEEDTTPADPEPDEKEGQGKSSASAAAPEVEKAVTEETHAIAAESTEELPETAEMPPGFLFKVQVMHDYAANDTDELEMKAGDVVLVVTFDNTEEQDDGWLMGLKQEDWQQNKENATKGVFPENFTQRL